MAVQPTSNIGQKNFWCQNLSRSSCQGGGSTPPSKPPPPMRLGGGEWAVLVQAPAAHNSLPLPPPQHMGSASGPRQRLDHPGHLAPSGEAGCSMAATCFPVRAWAVNSHPACNGQPVRRCETIAPFLPSRLGMFTPSPSPSSPPESKPPLPPSPSSPPELRTSPPIITLNPIPPPPFPRGPTQIPQGNQISSQTEGAHRAMRARCARAVHVLCEKSTVFHHGRHSPQDPEFHPMLF